VFCLYKHFICFCSVNAAAKMLWTEEMEMEVKTLFDEFNAIEEPPIGIDVVVVFI
jgi:hypothetical protein